jgi:hypothetical protein
MAMIAMTTSSSISVKAAGRFPLPDFGLGFAVRVRVVSLKSSLPE